MAEVGPHLGPAARAEAARRRAVGSGHRAEGHAGERARRTQVFSLASPERERQRENFYSVPTVMSKLLATSSVVIQMTREYRREVKALALLPQTKISVSV